MTLLTLFCAVLGLATGFCDGRPPPTPPPVLTPIAVTALPGWHDDAVAEALPALRRSCRRLSGRPPETPVGGVGGTAGDWAAACRELDGASADGARRVLEGRFRAYAVTVGDAADGLLTGYYEPEIDAALKRHGPYRTPIYGRPSDLVTVDLSAFRDDLSGRITGRVERGRLVPYPARAAIDGGALAGVAPVVAWARDPVDLFFLQIQGSGRLRLPDGRTVGIGYAAANGRPYYAIGRSLIASGAIPRERMSMQAIRAWLDAHPDRATALLHENDSYVFFALRDGPGPVGAEGTVLTPGRSLAVDPRFWPYGLPLWIDTAAAEPGQPRLRRLVVAQDTGGAIRGALRGDLFWGSGPEAEAGAGILRAAARFHVLLPASVDPAR